MPLTGQQVLQNAVALMGGDPTNIPAIQQTQALASINAQLADLFDVNNSLLAAKGQPELTMAMPAVSQLSDSVPYCDELARNVMHFGVARDLGIPRGNPNVSYFASGYEANKSRYLRGIPEDVADCYGGCRED
jgi:hypothetical protein